jgi:hypothetical protein
VVPRPPGPPSSRAHLPAATPRIGRSPLTDAGSGYYKVKNVGSGLSVGVAQSSTSDGAAVIQWNDPSVDDQLWKIVRIN